MAGKPEQPSTHPAPPNHGHHHHHHYQQQPQQQQQQQQQEQQQQVHPQHAQGIQQNSVLVYVSGENFAYATAVGQNAAAAAAAATAVGYQSPQQATYAGILPPQVATAAATFPAKTTIYCNDNSSVVGGTTNNCCRLKPLEYVSADGDSSRSVRSLSTGTAEDEEDYGTIISNNGLLYRQTNLVQAISTSATTTMTCAVSTCDNKNPTNRSPLENDANSTENFAANNVEPIGRVNGSEMVPNKLFPSRIHGDIYPPGARLADGYNNSGRIVQGNPGEGCVSLLSDDACVAYARQGNETSQTSASVYQGDSVEQRVNMDEKSRQQDGFDNQAGSSLSSSSSNVGVSGGGGVVVGSGGSGVASCDSVRSDTGESSTYSSLSSPESQSQSAHDGLSTATVNGGGSCAQQAARQPPLPRINSSNNNNNTVQQNVVLTMNGSAVITQQQQQTITVPRGWKRICTNGVIIYISPSSTALGSLDQLKEYLTTVGTCKCGLECPLRPEQVFNFDPKVATRPWSPDQGKTREMTKLCNHKRKLLLPTTAAGSSIASCTPTVSSSALSSGQAATPIHVNADSPTSPDKARKDGINKKKKRKLGGIGNIFSGVSVSQLMAQRERAIVAASGVQGSPVPNGSQVWPIAIPNLQVQQSNQQICHQTLNSPLQNQDVNGCATRNPQQRLSQHNMSGMLMGNSLIMNQQGANFNNMTQQQQQLLQQQHQQLILQQQQQQQQQLMQQHISQQQQQQQQQQQLLPHHQQMQHMQILHQHEQQQHQNTVVNQLTQQQAPHYVNQLNQQSLHVMQQQEHLNQQQQMHMQQAQKHKMQQQQSQQHMTQDVEQQSGSYNPQHSSENYIHHMQSSQVSAQTTLHPQLHQIHQHQMQQQAQQHQPNQHVMQTQSADHFQMQIQQLQQQQQQQHQQQVPQVCVQPQYPNQQLNHHSLDVMQQQQSSVMNAADMQGRHNRAPSVTDEDLNAKQMQQQQQQQLLLHNHTLQRHHVVQNGNLPNNSHENMQRMYTQNQVQYPVRNFDTSKGTVADVKHQQQYALSNLTGRSPNTNHAVEAQPGMGPNGQPGNMHFNSRTPPWQQNRSASASHQPSLVTVQNITCNSFDRVPPLHHHIPQASTWTDEVARKKAKSSKIMVKKQRQHSVTDVRSNSLDQSAPSPIDEFNEKNQQSNNQIGSTVNSTGPSFLDDPSGYLAQQTALLNSTISRQTGVSSSQVGMINNSKTSQTNHGSHLSNNSYLPQPKPSSGTSPTSTSTFNSVKNHATSPVVVHSSMTPTSSSGGTDSESSPCQGCVTSADTQSYVQDQYKQQMQRQYLIHSDQREDPVTSSTFGEQYQNNQPQADSRPIQGGTVSTSHGSPIGTNSPANSDTPASSTPGISQPATPQSLISSQPSTPHSYSQPPTPHSHSMSGQVPSQPLTPQAQQPSQSSMSSGVQEQRSETPCSATTSSNVVPSSTSSSQTSTSTSDNVTSQMVKRQTARQSSLDGYQPHPHTVNAISRMPMNHFNGTSSVITTMASGHTVSSNTITSVLAGRANTATVSINTPSGIPNPAIPDILSNKPQHQASSTALTNVPTTTVTTTSSLPSSQPSITVSVSKSPLEMVQSVVSSIQVPQPSTSSPVQPQNQQQQQQPTQQHPQSNVQVHNVLTSGGILKHPTGSTLPPGHILVSNGGQLIMASTGSGINGVMAPPPPKIISNSSSMPPLSVSPMVTSVTGAVSQVIPAVGVAQQVIGQPTVLVNTIQTPVLIQPGVMTMDSIGQNVQIPHLTVATGNVIQNAQSILDANQDVARNVGANQGMVNRQPALLSPESAMSKKKAYKKRKANPQTVASMLHIASSQQNTGMLMQSQSNFAQQNFQTQSIGGPMLQALTIVPGKGGAPAQLVMNGQAGTTSAQFNAQQIITNPQPAQQINLLQPVNLLNGATGMVQNFPTIQQFIVPGIGSMVMSADGTATLLQDTGNIGMQLQIQNVNGQNVLTPVQSHSGIFNPSQSILAAGPAGMVIRAPQTAGGKIIQQHSPSAQFLSPNSGQFLVNGTTSFGNQLSPIVANVSPNQQVTFNTSQVRPTNMQGQQEFIQMNGQTLMVPCGTAQNIAVSSAPNQQNTTFVQQNTTIVQQQTTMVSNNQIPNFQAAASNGTTVDPSLNIDHNQSYILSSGMIQGKPPNSPKSSVNSPSSEQNIEQQQYVLASSSTTVVEKTAQQSDQHSPLMARHSVSTQTAGNQANMAQSAMMRQGSPPDTTTHSPGNSQRSNSPAVDTTTHGAASPAPPARHHSSSTPMVHCVSSSEPDSGDIPVASEDWRIQGITTKEITLSQPGLHGKTYVESTVTTGIQIYTSETLKQAEGVVSTVRCEGREHALGRGIKRKLDSIDSMHSTLHEDQDVAEAKSEEKNQRKLEVGELVWGAARGSPAWPGKVESLGPPGTMTVWVRWYGGGGGRSQVEVKALKSLSEGLEAHHRARKKFRKSRKLNMQLENAIQEAMSELDKMTESRKEQKTTGRSCKVTGSKGPESGGASKSEGKRSSKKSVGSVNPVTSEQKPCR